MAREAYCWPLVFSLTSSSLFINFCVICFTKLQVISLKQVLPRPCCALEKKIATFVFRGGVNCLQDALSSGGDSITQKERKRLKRGKDRLKFVIGRCPTDLEVTCGGNLC